MKIICVGLNYKSHIEEMEEREDVGTSPILFMKPDTALLTDDKGRFFIPDFTSEVHYEVELVVKINKMGKNIAERFAHRYYEEITVGVDFTARDLQTQCKREGLPWEIAKAFDTSAAVGKFINKQALTNHFSFSLKKNNVVVQTGNTVEMIHSIDKIIAYASQFFTLKTGDLLFTGTPSGVARIDVGDHLEGMLNDIKLLDITIC